jgi:hypothetical protein
VCSLATVEKRCHFELLVLLTTRLRPVVSFTRMSLVSQWIQWTTRTVVETTKLFTDQTPLLVVRHRALRLVWSHRAVLAEDEVRKFEVMMYGT